MPAIGGMAEPPPDDCAAAVHTEERTMAAVKPIQVLRMQKMYAMGRVARTLAIGQTGWLQGGSGISERMQSELLRRRITPAR